MSKTETSEKQNGNVPNKKQTALKGHVVDKELVPRQNKILKCAGMNALETQSQLNFVAR